HQEISAKACFFIESRLLFLALAAMACMVPGRAIDVNASMVRASSHFRWPAQLKKINIQARRRRAFFASVSMALTGVLIGGTCENSP
ncbi:MAG: hypothetical protein RR283_00735, partial [Comamonas sp.]